MPTCRSRFFASLAVGLVLVLAAGTAIGYSALRSHKRTVQAVAATGGNPGKAQNHIQRFGCAGCHTIAGGSGASGLVGPPLQQIRDRIYVGSRPNTADNLIEWIVNPRAVNPHTPMPVTGISESEARDVVAFLYAR
jgi:cytochrome c2